MAVWVEGELAGCTFPDKRLKSRLTKLLGRLSGKIGDSLPAACGDWASTKAAYRFLDNDVSVPPSPVLRMMASSILPALSELPIFFMGKVQDAVGTFGLDRPARVHSRKIGQRRG